MRISPFAGGQADRLALFHANESADQAPVDAPADELSLDTEMTFGQNAVLGAILAQFDVHDVTPSVFSEMVASLHQVDLLSSADQGRLDGTKHDLASFGVQEDESVDLLDFYEHLVGRTKRILSDQEGPPAKETRSVLERQNWRLDWVEKISILQSSPQVGIDATV